MERTPVIDADRGAADRGAADPRAEGEKRGWRVRGAGVSHKSARLRRTAGRSVATHEEILDSLNAISEEERQREVAKVLLALQWARLNPQQGPKLEPRVFDGTGRRDRVREAKEIWLALADYGCYHVDELTIPAYAAAAGISESRAGSFLAESMLVVMLLPRVWKRAVDGDLEVWRALKLAGECWDLSPQAIAYIDHQMSKTNARHTVLGRAGVIEEAKIRFMPEQAHQEKEQAQERRGVHFDFLLDQQAGLAHFAGTLSLLDGIDLKLAIEAGAAHLKAQGANAPLGVRQAWALGDLARSSKFLPERPFVGGGASCSVEGPNVAPTEERPRWTGTGAPTSLVMMYLHLTPDSLAGGEFSDRSPIRVEGANVPRGTVLTPKVVQEWFRRPGAGVGQKIVFRPVIDLDDHYHVDAYEVPKRIKEQVGLRDGGCVFPWCTRKPWSTDCDHIAAWKEDGTGGPTCSCNLAPLCRRHHRAKTHADNHKGSVYTWWTYESLGDGKYLWHGPGDSVLLRTVTGVFKVPSKAPPPKRSVAAAMKTAGRISETIPALNRERFERPPPVQFLEDVGAWCDQLGRPPPF